MDSRQTDRQTDTGIKSGTQTDRQTDTGIKSGTLTGRQTGGHIQMDKETVVHVCRELSEKFHHLISGCGQ